ncbi:MAG: protein-glutamine glutaminase family protein [Flavobacterium sp.]|uniref:protein-glutamine glutaminase family protein n=1 Tax=Flavobacterium sp. TaxID=239 RepID=UPI00260CB47F|nr:protein-glutamine glutaminase family protein [Flavobacterium sp.]MDD5150416.1 protein-glutamine glutaminase family protein [Flavobacterium sp.]
MNTANALFTEILKSGIPFGYQQANCHNISHYISILLESKGYRCAKIWAFAPVVYSTSSSRLITFTDKKNISPTGKIDWGYHVAPILQVRIGTKVRKMVIDPGLFKTPVRYRTWLAKLKTRKLIYLIMDSEWYLFNSSMITNLQLQQNIDIIQPNVKLPDWFSDKLITDFFKYEDDALEQHWIEKGLAVNETAMAFYTNEIKPLLHSKIHLDLVNDYKMLVGNVFNFETIFRDNNWNYEMDDTFQYNHQDIIAKYREIYSSNLIKWQKSMASLNEIISKKHKK